MLLKQALPKSLKVLVLVDYPYQSIIPVSTFFVPFGMLLRHSCIFTVVNYYFECILESYRAKDYPGSEKHPTNSMKLVCTRKLKAIHHAGIRMRITTSLTSKQRLTSYVLVSPQGCDYGCSTHDLADRNPQGSVTVKTT